MNVYFPGLVGEADVDVPAVVAVHFREDDDEAEELGHVQHQARRERGAVEDGLRRVQFLPGRPQVLQAVERILAALLTFAATLYAFSMNFGCSLPL